MFRINRRTDYAVRVMVALAKRPSGQRLATQAIQEEMLVPRAFLQRIIADLAKAGLVLTFAGPGGGLELARPSAAINLRHVWEAIEGPLLISECLTGCGDCPHDRLCPVRWHWGTIQAQMQAELERTSLAVLVQEAHDLAQRDAPCVDLTHLPLAGA